MHFDLFGLLCEDLSCNNIYYDMETLFETITYAWTESILYSFILFVHSLKP